jgi:hypothetical protein
MKKQRFLFIILISVFGLAAAALVIFNFFVPKASGLLIETSPASTVYINGEEVGRTPYTSLKSPGEITLRLIPDSFGMPLTPYEEKIGLVSGVETVVRRYFGANETFTEGEVLSFEKLTSKNTSGITVITDPENVQVTIDGVSKGISPYTTQEIEDGVKKIKLSAEGLKDREIEVNLISGYKLVAFIKLSKIETAKKVEVEEDVVKMVKILETPTGFLRIRKEASSSAAEVGRVKEGEEYELMGESAQGDWYKISPKEGVTGWVTNQYSEVVTKERTATESAKTP